MSARPDPGADARRARSGHPPRLAETLYARHVPGEFREFALGDMAQEYAERREQRGRIAAGSWYWWRALRALAGAENAPRSHSPWGGRGPRPGGWLDTLRRDVTLALRSFARTPLFTAAALVTLALGIGATTAVFSLADAVLFRPMPGVAAPDDVAEVVACGESPRPDSCRMMGLSYPNLRDVDARLQNAAGIGGAVMAGDEEVVVGDAPPMTLYPQYVSASWFEVLGMQPQLGRTFTEEEDDPAAGAPLAVISYRLWVTLFDRSPEVLGAEILVNGKPFTVIGVAQRGFRGARRSGSGYDLWLPGGTMLWVKEWEGDTSDRATTSDFNYMVIRRNAGVSWQQVEAELDSFGSWLAEQYPEANAKFAQGDFRVRPDALDAPSQSVTIMTALLAVVGLVLLIACANVSTLLLIKGIRRQGEVAVRKALGASTLRLLGQHLTESVTLWLLGGVVGTALALVIMSLVDRNLPSFAGMVWLDARVLTFVGVLSLTVGLLFGVLPALAVTRVQAARWIGQGTTMVTGGRGRLRGAMTALQLAVTLTLLVGALLTHRTLDALAAVDLGFEPRGMTVFRVSTGRTRYDDNGRVEYYRSMLRGLRSDPAVADASMAWMVPFLDGGISATLKGAGDEGEGASVLSTSVGPRFFETLRIALRAGRTFTDEEAFDPVRDSPLVLGASTARRLFGDRDPLGELVVFEHEERAGIRHRVIGVVEDVRFTPSSLTADFEPLVYEPFPVAGQISGDTTFMVRARPGAGNVGAVIRATAASVDENTRVTGLRPYVDAVARWYGDTALLAALSAATAVLAAILAAVGLYGVVGVAADARMREFGIRVALGAGPRTLMAAVVQQALGVVLAGLLLGAAGSYALGVVIESFLYGVTPLDPVSWALAALFLSVVAAVAIIAPARRATTLDPVEVLRAG